jgi:predicted TPR repeat methyltransferase
VFVYVGDLGSIFGGVRRALRDNGLFCFSVEATDERDFVLRSTLRYAHSIDYLRRLAGQHQFAIEAIESRVIRRDTAGNIDGYLAVMRCA